MIHKVYRNLIPQQLGQTLRNRARKSTGLIVENFIDLRDFIHENREKIEAEGWMGFYEEAADWMDYSSAAVQKNLHIIREYPTEKINEWIGGGLSMSHMEEAGDLQNDKNCHYTADQLLDACLTFGDENGKRMTVKQMTSFALGEKIGHSPTYDYVRVLSSMAMKLPARLGWDEEKTKRFGERVKELIKEFLQ